VGSNVKREIRESFGETWKDPWFACQIGLHKPHRLPAIFRQCNGPQKFLRFCRAFLKACTPQRPNQMELDPEDFKQTFAETWAEWVKESKAGSMQIGFPAEVIDRVNTLGPPSWDLIDTAIEKLLKENRLEQAIQDLERLMDDEDSFQWPLSNPHYCLALGVFRKFNEQFFANLPEEQDESEEDEADWWKSAE
jgi:hypothetical protein